MNNTLQQLYYHLPAPIRSIVASLKGLQVRSCRYGPETERLMEDALERERWNSEQWKNWHDERLAYILHRAVKRVPFYRQEWALRRRRGDRASWEYLENWPLLTKKSLQENPRAFVADDQAIRALYYDHTSGTSGTPLRLWLSKEAIRSWFALFEVRARGWNGVSRHENWATLGGQMVVPPDQRRAPFWVWNAPMKQLYLSANHISRQNAPAYLAALKRYRITHMVAYSFSVAALAREALSLGINLPDLRLVITIAEPLISWQRNALHEGFRCQIRESYGMSEMVTEATECSAGSLHLWPEVGLLEVFDEVEDVAVPARTSGRLIATGLLNADMPLIRYSVGDRGTMAHSAGFCSCNRSLPVMTSVDGRVDDVLYAKDGRWLGRLDTVFKADLPLKEAQIIQETLDSVRIRYVASKHFTPEASRIIVERLQARMGPVDVIMEEVNKVPRTANGKFRAVICNLPEKERQNLRKGSS